MAFGDAYVDEIKKILYDKNGLKNKDAFAYRGIIVMKILRKFLIVIMGLTILQIVVNNDVFADDTICPGDINLDGIVNEYDVFLMQSYLSGQSEIQNMSIVDISGDSELDVTDLILLRAILTGDYTSKREEYEFISPPVARVGSSLYSQGTQSLLIFCVEFTDCKYDKPFTADTVDKTAFSEPDEKSENYPFESMTAFYDRSSKHSMKLTGKTYRYTAQYPIEYYQDDYDKLIRECIKAFDPEVDYRDFDMNKDGIIDSLLISVPESASDDYWWPCSGPSVDYIFRADGVRAGNNIIGNVAPYDVKNFNSSYLHELGHCMGLPDYYLYYSEEYEGMNGKAGPELMDADAYSDMSAFSKLMLGWYRENQINIYDKSAGTTEYELINAQTDNGNCIIIPKDNSGELYFSEYMIIEYITEDGNNKALNDLWWQEMSSGVRIMHIKADFVFGPWWNYFKYENGSEETGYNDEGIRLLRLVNDGEDPFVENDVIDNCIQGFGWYDENENETVDPGVIISIGKMDSDSCIISISSK